MALRFCARGPGKDLAQPVAHLGCASPQLLRAVPSQEARWRPVSLWSNSCNTLRLAQLLPHVPPGAPEARPHGPPKVTLQHNRRMRSCAKCAMGFGACHCGFRWPRCLGIVDSGPWRLASRHEIRGAPVRTACVCIYMRMYISAYIHACARQAFIFVGTSGFALILVNGGIGMSERGFWQSEFESF